MLLFVIIVLPITSAESTAIATHFLTLLLIACAASIAACGPTMPDCPYRTEQPPVASAGCALIEGGALLVVADFSNRISVPGGSGEADEAPRCTAHRETWEETGLNVDVGKVEMVFDTGFHLFRCRLASPKATINPPPRLEVRRAWFLPLAQFSKFEWRYPYQQALMADWVRKENREP